MGWIACFGDNGGSGTSAGIAVDLMLYRNGYLYNEDMELARGIGGSGAADDHETIFQFTATGDIDVTLNTFCIMTNTGNNDGYFELIVGGTSKYKKMLTSNTFITLNDMPVVSLSNGDTLECRVGFDNSHSGCNFYYRRYNPNA